MKFEGLFFLGLRFFDFCGLGPPYLRCHRARDLGGKRTAVILTGVSVTHLPRYMGLIRFSTRWLGPDYWGHGDLYFLLDLINTAPHKFGL